MTQYEPAYQMPHAAANEPQRNPHDYQHFEVRPLSGALGAELIGVDVNALSDAAFGELRQALLDHQVLAIRDQDLTPAGQTSFGERFGPLKKYDFVDPLDEHPFVTEIRSEPEDIFNFGGGWHSDSMNYERPPGLTMLYARECPPVGGDTAFANLYLAWESLSPGLRALLQPMKQITATSLSYGSSTMVGTSTYKDQISTPTQMAAEQEDDEFEHPVARTHPDTGRLALYVCSAYTARFKSMTRSESLPLLKHLFEQTYQPEFTCRVTWQPGTLTVWDNRCVVHYAHNDYPGSLRIMHRVIVDGERPS
tara:strand:- start:394 stop:1317 length:924 start_codon:yes stop_codon:yes gene_type:complete